MHDPGCRWMHTGEAQVLGGATSRERHVDGRQCDD